MTPIFRAKIEGGKLHVDRPDELAAHLTGMEGQRVELTVREHKGQRSGSQNRYFHGVVCRLIGDHLGYETDEIKEILKTMFLWVDDGKYAHCRSTSGLNTKDMAEFTEKCKRWAAQSFQLYIPDPGEVEE